MKRGGLLLCQAKKTAEKTTEAKKTTKKAITKAKTTSKKSTKEVKEEKKEEVNEEPEEQYDYVVSYDSEQRLWGVKKSNGKKTLKRFVTKQEAIDYAKTFAEKYNTKVIANKKNEEQ